MNDARLRELRRSIRRGELPADLVAVLQAVARDLARRGGLPPALAPYGRWDNEAAEELFASWYTDRLLGRGDLPALLDRAATPAALRRLAARSLRQHLLNARDRSQAQNLYRRLVTLLAEDPVFRVVAEARRPQDRWFGDAAAAHQQQPWAGPERLLLGHAWALGDFAVVRYRADAAKLSPVLDADDLRRFVLGLLRRADAALTPDLLMRALAARFDLGPAELVAADEHRPAPSREPSPAEAVAIRETARAVVAELTERQATVLRMSGTAGVAEIADAVGCSAGTVVNEQRRIGALVARLTADAPERDRVLNAAADLLYVDEDA